MNRLQEFRPKVEEEENKEEQRLRRFTVAASVVKKSEGNNMKTESYSDLHTWLNQL